MPHEDLLKLLEKRFSENPQRHPEVAWQEVKTRLSKQPKKLRALEQMEASGGEPDVVGMDAATGEILFFDCSPESPKGRRSLCYDRAALDKRKEHKPAGNAMEQAEQMGAELLDEAQYLHLQQTGSYDSKTSSWLLTPPAMRKLGGALFGDTRYGRVFFYHNGAESYYSSRGFRTCLRV